ncbi:MAG: LON peptidase substrate-binding domain-containing protein, partial [Planctomycetota bacterium]|nr:LON peptidase substrate-binding domain-containing protein [Planctomycetota bacterium]
MSKPDPQASPPVSPVAARMPVLPLRGLVAFPGLAMPLQVGRDSSVQAVHDALANDGRILLVAQRDPECQEPGPGDLYAMGAIGHVIQCFKAEGGTHKVIVEATARGASTGAAQQNGCLWAEVACVEEPALDGPEAEALTRTVRARFFAYLQLQPAVPESIGQQAAAADDGRRLADVVAAFTAIPFADKQRLLEMVDPEERLRTLADLLENEIALLEIQ